MAKESLIDGLRMYLEGVENYWLALAIIMLFFSTIAGFTLVGIYFYTQL